jgi:hypothetical protein
VALGVLFAASGAGGALAAAVAARWQPPRPLRAIWAAWGGAGLAAVLLGLAPDMTTAVIFGGLTWCGVSYGNVLWFPMMQRYVPAGMLGRASAVDWTLSLALVPLGTVAAGTAGAALLVPAATRGAAGPDDLT